MKSALLILALTICLGMTGCIQQSAVNQSSQASSGSAPIVFTDYETYTVNEYYTTVLRQVDAKMSTCGEDKGARHQIDTGKKDAYYFFTDGAQQAVFMVHMKGKGVKETTVTVRVPEGKSAEWAKAAEIVKAGAHNAPECP